MSKDYGNILKDKALDSINLAREMSKHIPMLNEELGETVELMSLQANRMAETVRLAKTRLTQGKLYAGLMAKTKEIESSLLDISKSKSELMGQENIKSEILGSLLREQSDTQRRIGQLNRDALRIMNDAINSGRDLNATEQSTIDNLTQSINLLMVKKAGLKDQVKQSQTEVSLLRKQISSSIELQKSKERELDIVREGKDAMKEVVASTRDAISSSQNLSKALSLGNSFSNALVGNIGKFIQKIPGGSAIVNAMGLDQIQKKMSDVSSKIFKQMYEGTLSVGTGFQRLGKVAMGTLNNIAKHPILLALAAVVAMVVAAFKRFVELDKAAEAFRKSTDLIKSQTKDIELHARQINVSLRYAGVTIAEIYKSAEAIVGAFQTSQAVTKDLMETTAKFAANLGVAEESTVGVYQKFLGMAGQSAESAKNAMNIGVALSAAAGVPIAAVFKDIAEASNETITFLGKSPKLMMLTAIEARRLGTTMESLSKSARGLLNFQDSINAEMEASAITGRTLNFQAARQLAFQGDIVKSRQEAMRQIKSLGDFQKMSVYQQEAVAKAAGMEVSEIVKMQAQEKQLAAFKRADRAGYMKYMAAKAAMEQGSTKSLAEQGAELAKQQQRQGEISNLTNRLQAIWTEISDELLPIANSLMPAISVAARVLVVIMKVISGTIRGMLSPISKIIGQFDSMSDSLKPLNKFFDGMEEKVKTIGESLGTGYVWIRMWIPVFGKMLKNVNLIGSRIMWWGKLLGSISEAFFELGKAILKPIYWMVSGFAKLNGVTGETATYLKDLFDSIRNGIGNSKLMKWVNGVGKTFKDFLSTIGKTGEVSASMTKKFKWLETVIENVGKLRHVFSDFITVFKSAEQMGSVATKSFGWVRTVANLAARLYGYFKPLILAVKNVGTAAKDVIPFVGKMLSYLGRIGKFAGAVLKLAGAFSKMIPIIGWIITGFQALVKWVKDLFGIWGNVSSWTDVPMALLKSLASLGTSIASVFLEPFDMILGWFGVDLPNGILGGILSIGTKVFEVIFGMFFKAYDKVAEFFVGHSPSKLGLGIVKGLTAVAGMVLDAITWPFKMALKVVKWYVGFVVNSISTITSFIWKAAKVWFNVISWPYKMAWKTITWFVNIIRDNFSTIVSVAKKVATTLFNVIAWPYKMSWSIVKWFVGMIKNNFSAITGFMKKAAQMWFDAITWPFKMVKSIVSYFVDNAIKSFNQLSDVFKGMGSSIKSALNGLFDILTLPFRKAYDWIANLFVGNSPSKLGEGIVIGIKSVVDTILELMVYPFQKAFELIKPVITGVVDLIASAAGKIFDILISPFKSVINFIKNSSVLKKIFGSNDAAEINATVKTETVKKVEAVVTIKNLDSLEGSIDKLSESIDNLGRIMIDTSSPSTFSSMFNSKDKSNDIIVKKLDELITLMANGGIAVQLDGRKVSTILSQHT